MKTYTLKFLANYNYSIYDGATLLTNEEVTTLFSSAGSAYFVFDFNGAVVTQTTKLSIVKPNGMTAISVEGLPSGTIKENYNFKGTWAASASDFTSFTQLQGQALDEAQLGFLMGKIKEAGPGIAKVLTTADYNYPTNNPTMVAAWKLDPGVYETSGNSVRVGFATAVYTDFADKTSFTVIKNGYSDTSYIICGTADNQAPSVYVTKTSTGAIEFGAPISLLSDIFADQGTKKKIQIGSSASANGNNSVAIGASSATGSVALESVAIGRGSGSGAQYTVSVGSSSQAKSDYAISIGNLAGNTSTSNSRSIQIGYDAQSTASNAIALGAYSKTTTAGEMNIGTGTLASGYNRSSYRLLSGVYDGQSNHDAATLAQGNKLMTTAPATTDAGVLGQLWTDTTAMHTYQLTAIDTTDPDNPSYTWTQRW